MPKLKVSLSIGIANASQDDILEIDDTEWEECRTQQEQEELMEDYWKTWSGNYIDGGFELVD